MSVHAKITVRGLKEMRADLVELLNAADIALVDWGNEFLARAKEYAIEGIISGPASGRVYRRYNPYRIHQASAPGQYPASDLGNLEASIEVKPMRDGRFKGTVGSSLAYAGMLEHGTSKMAARPWLVPSMEKASNEMEGELRKYLEKRL